MFAKDSHQARETAEGDAAVSRQKRQKEVSYMREYTLILTNKESREQWPMHARGFLWLGKSVDRDKQYILA